MFRPPGTVQIIFCLILIPDRDRGCPGRRSTFRARFGRKSTEICNPVWCPRTYKFKVPCAHGGPLPALPGRLRGLGLALTFKTTCGHKLAPEFRSPSARAVRGPLCLAHQTTDPTTKCICLLGETVGSPWDLGIQMSVGTIRTGWAGEYF